MSRVAAIDCGTNSIRLLIADFDGSGSATDVHREMRIVRLGQGVDATGLLAAEAIERTRAALVDYAARFTENGVERIRMVATSATRDAANREEFFAMTREVLGTEAEVISGDEEARLSFAGAVAAASEEEGPFLVVDVGGGSTELVLGTLSGGDVAVEAARSVDIGCVRLTERCLHSDPPSATELAEAERVAAEVLESAFEVVPVGRARTWIGVAGTVTTLSAVAQELPAYDSERTHGSVLSTEQIRATEARLAALSTEQRRALGPVHEGRADVITGGAVVVRVLAEQLAERAGIGQLLVSEKDILDGIATSIA
ncbi:Ppx/GppA phosphatase family protein [Sciscionella sediminilitoris]|uniref:Ppx/GppA phosphatase family protein n=1 Tax=Sciscionella sediminilitoris TaxID=1445613 RepID=UPI0004DF0592|nr:Ppx/GppA phosphatase family protein [Sciscionella sp. SE31]